MQEEKINRRPLRDISRILYTSVGELVAGAGHIGSSNVTISGANELQTTTVECVTRPQLEASALPSGGIIHGTGWRNAGLPSQPQAIRASNGGQ